MTRHKLPALGFTAAVLASALVVAACGGNNGYGSTASPTVAATATPKASVSPAPAPTKSATPAPTAASSATVGSATNSTLNKAILVDSAGMTLYTYGKDTSGTSACSGACAANWPPLAPGAGSPTAGSGVSGTLATITRADGTMQVTYNGLPLYNWVGDQQPGDVTGDGVENFHVAVP